MPGHRRADLHRPAGHGYGKVVGAVVGHQRYEGKCFPQRGRERLDPLFVIGGTAEQFDDAGCDIIPVVLVRVRLGQPGLEHLDAADGIGPAANCVFVFRRHLSVPTQSVGGSRTG